MTSISIPGCSEQSIGVLKVNSLQLTILYPTKLSIKHKNKNEDIFAYKSIVKFVFHTYLFQKLLIHVLHGIEKGKKKKKGRHIIEWIKVKKIMKGSQRKRPKRKQSKLRLGCRQLQIEHTVQ